MIYIIFQKNVEYSIKSKLFNVCILVLIIFLLHIFVVFRDNYLDPLYLKIKQFEDSISKSIFEIFFENPIKQMIKFREFNFKDSSLIINDFNKTDNPDVSVIITVYNQAHCFYGALRSVQSQTLKNLEIILIDDCSLDNTTEVIKTYMKEDKRIALIIKLNFL